MLASSVSLWQQNVEKSEKLMNKINIEEENLHILWTTWGISTNFSEKMRLMIISQKIGLHPVSEKCIFGKTTEGVKLTPSYFRVKISKNT